MNIPLYQILESTGYYVSTTVGSSMLPLLRDRKDRVIILPVPKEGLEKYDLALYLKPDGKYVLHRIVGVRKDLYLIRGDNTFEVERVPKEWVIGYADEIYRKRLHIRCNKNLYLLYAKFWNLIYPFRAVCHFFNRVLRAISKRKK